MVQLTDNEKRMLDGDQGRLTQICMENIVRYARILGAEALCEVSKATVFCGSHNYLSVANSSDPDLVFSKMNLATYEIIPFDQTSANCYTQSCVAPCDQYEHLPFNQSPDFFAMNSDFLEQARNAGVIITGSCAPYLTGWIPIQGEHFVTTESGVTAMGNSIWGAMGNSDGIEAAFWSAVCGRTPLWGKHLAKNRVGTQLYKIEARVENLLEWDLLGQAIGARLPAGGIPVISSKFTGVNFQKLRQLCTTIAISSDATMCHVVGYTPEARSIEDALQGRDPEGEFLLGEEDLQTAFEGICDHGSREIDFVSLGCPHYDIDQIKRAAEYLEGKKISPNVNFMIWTVYPLKAMADENGYTRIIEDAGGHIYTSSCPSSIGEVFLKNYNGMVFDSLKQAGSIKSESDAAVFLGDVYRCIDAAVSGRWDEEQRWTPSK
jgi:cis-L-3-hydroxyproline dehydratase